MAETTNKIAGVARTKFGKGAARKLRVAGKIPAVIYGHGAETQHIALPAHEISLILRKANQVLTIEVDGKTELTLVKDVQKDPVRAIIEHLDLVAIKKGEKVHVEVPVHLEGESFPGTLAILEVGTIRVGVEATNIPENIKLDISGAVDGTLFHAKDLPLPKGASLLDDEELLMVNIVLPQAPSLSESENEEAAEAATAEGEKAAE